MSSLVTKFEWGFLHPRNWGLWIALALLWLLSFLPRPLFNAIAGSAGSLAMSLNRKRRQIAETNLKLCFPNMKPGERNQLMQRNARITGQCLMDLGTLWVRGSRRLDKHSRVEGAEHVYNIHEQGGQVILMTCHTMALDHGAQAMALKHPDVHAVSMYKQQGNRLLAWLMYRGRTRHGSTIYDRDEGLRGIIRDVKKGAVFYYLPDEDLGPDESVFAPLFGVPKATLPALGSLARLTGAAILPCISHYDEKPGEYVVEILPPLIDFPVKDRDASAERMNQVLEEMIQRDPAQYMWFHKLFRTRPEGEDAFY